MVKPSTFGKSLRGGKSDLPETLRAITQTILTGITRAKLITIGVKDSSPNFTAIRVKENKTMPNTASM
jgi:hypothetical protein